MPSQSASEGFKSPPEFLQLPYDIHSLILNYLDPSDIISIRKTCKIMLNATLQRGPWLKAIQRMCQENCVYEPSFPVDDMNLLELEYAALSPKRWEILANSRKDSPFGEMLPVISTQVVTAANVIFYRVYLIPGGRFLVIMSNNRLEIWDLLADSSDSVNAIASIPNHYSTFSVHPTADPLGIRISAHRQEYLGDGHPMRQHYEIYEIFPLQRDRRLVSLGRLSIRSAFDRNFFSVFGDRLVLVHGPIIKIWDFVTNEWATWNTTIYSRQILMDEKTVVLIGEFDLTVWDFPQLSGDARQESRKREPSDPAKPRTVLHFPEARPNRNCDWCGLCDWYTGSPQPLIFDLLPWRVDLKLFRFEVSLQSPLRLQDQLLFSPDSSFRLPMTTRLPPSMIPYRILGKNLAVGWSDRKNVFCHVGPIISGSLPIVTTLLNIRQPNMRCLSFCPISGKLCYFDSTTHEVKVLHYFPSPRTSSEAQS